MEKIIGTMDLETGLYLDAAGKAVDFITTETDGKRRKHSITMAIGNGKANTAILADAIWQGCKAMLKELADPSTDEERKAYLLSRTRINLYYHYLVLGCTDEDARAMAAKEITE